MNRLEFLKKASKLSLLAVFAIQTSGKADTESINDLVVYADGIHDDTVALTAWGHGIPVYYRDGTRVNPKFLNGQTFKLTCFSNPIFKAVAFFKGVDYKNNILYSGFNVKQNSDNLYSLSKVKNNDVFAITNCTFRIEEGSVSTFIKNLNAYRRLKLI